MEVLEKASGILTNCGYADGTIDDAVSTELVYWDDKPDHYEPVDPFADTLEGRRQADAIEGWLRKNNHWAYSWHIKQPATGTGQTYHQWRLDRIKWCLERLANDS